MSFIDTVFNKTGLESINPTTASGRAAIRDIAETRDIFRNGLPRSTDAETTTAEKQSSPDPTTKQGDLTIKEGNPQKSFSIPTLDANQKKFAGLALLGVASFFLIKAAM